MIDILIRFSYTIRYAILFYTFDTFKHMIPENRCISQVDIYLELYCNFTTLHQFICSFCQVEMNEHLPICHYHLLCWVVASSQACIRNCMKVKCIINCQSLSTYSTKSVSQWNLILSTSLHWSLSYPDTPQQTNNNRRLCLKQGRMPHRNE